MQSRNSRTAQDMTVLAGWLFADLLLALMVIFMAAQPAFPKMSLTPTATAIVLATPTPKTLARLDPDKHRFVVHVDRAAFLENDQTAVNAVQQQIAGQRFLQGRSAGLILAFGTALSDCTSEGAYTVALKVYSLVRHLGQTDATFKNTVDFDPLCDLNTDANQITIDIFLFAQQ